MSKQVDFTSRQIDDIITMYKNAKKHLENLEDYPKSLAEVRLNTLEKVINILDLDLKIEV